jgi:hypothetical protein
MNSSKLTKTVIDGFVRSCGTWRSDDLRLAAHCELHSPAREWASDHQLVEPSAQEFIPPVNTIVKGALNMLGESAVAHACERRFDKTDPRSPGGNTSRDVDSRAINVPELYGIETPPRFCSLPRARWQRVQESENIFENLAPLDGQGKILDRSQVLGLGRWR